MILKSTPKISFPSPLAQFTAALLAFLLGAENIFDRGFNYRSSNGGND
jgi:hypothetical protein